MAWDQPTPDQENEINWDGVFAEHGTSVRSRATVSEVRLSGDTAVVSTKTDIGIVSTGGRADYVFTSRDTWTMKADGWKLKESLAISSRGVAPKTDPEATKAVAAELKQRAAALATVEAGAKTDDQAAFGKAVGDARIVALGEASHGTREFFQMKHRLLEYLVIAQPSGTDALDRAAVAGISASNPSPPLPSEFRGDQIRVQFSLPL